MTDEPTIEVPAPPESPVPVESGFPRPVLLKAVVDAARGARRAIDGTLGDGGHAEALREAGIELLGIDRDPEAIRIAQARLGDAGIRYLTAPFASEQALAEIHDFEPDFVLLDLGVSSRQLDEEARGFTFRPGAPLDMRMGADGPTAADLLNTVDKDTLRAWLADWADERRAHRLAGEIVRRREHGAFALSDDLVNAIRGVLGPRSGPEDFARIFQALRIAVNQELDGLVEALPALRDALAPGGSLAVISYHSGEDRVVKHAFHEWSRACICPSEQPVCTCRGRPLGVAAPRSGIVPDPMEIADNSRARSARLRIFRTAHDA
jgi:16S rRNA (cytosine1402-N4)-methyltransferase